MFKSSSEKKLFWLIVSVKLAFVIGVVFALGESKLVWGDGGLYIEVGKNIWQHARFGTGVGGVNPETLFMPLYPIIVGAITLLTQHGIALISALQALAAGFIALLTYRIALRFVSPRYAMAAAFLTAFQPVAFFLNAFVMTETLALLFLLMFVYLFLRYRDTRDTRTLALSALAFALALLVRNVMLYLFIIPVLYILIEKWGSIKARVLHGALFLIIPALLLTPWVIRNALLTGTASADFGGSNNICGYQLFATYAAEHKLGITRQFQIWDDPNLQVARERCLAQGDATRLFTIATEYPRGFMKANALTTLALLTNDGVNTLFQNSKEEAPSGIPLHHNYLTPMVFMGDNWRENVTSAVNELSAVEFTFVFGLKLFWVIITLSAIVGVVHAYNGKRRREVLFFLLIIAYLISVTVLSTAFGVGARLRYPIEPFLFICAVTGLSFLSSRSLQKN